MIFVDVSFVLRSVCCVGLIFVSLFFLSYCWLVIFYCVLLLLSVCFVIYGFLTNDYDSCLYVLNICLEIRC